MSTSGNSKNIIKAIKIAKKLRLKTVAFIGNSGGKSKGLSDMEIIIPSRNVARIQETHIFLGHNILNEVEKKLIKLNN